MVKAQEQFCDKKKDQKKNICPQQISKIPARSLHCNLENGESFLQYPETAKRANGNHS